MNPFMNQLSQTVHNERVQAAEYRRNLSQNGTNKASGFNVPNISKAAALLSEKIKMQLHFAPTASR